MVGDFYRDTWVRYLGYANEVGESFRGIVPRKVVVWSYQLAFTYVLADTIDKTWKRYRSDGSTKQVIVAAGDALIWQTLASIIIPGITINRICAYTRYGLDKYAGKVPIKARSLIVVGVGLASIPIIVRPIDTGVNVFMNITYRNIFGY